METSEAKKNLDLPSENNKHNNLDSKNNESKIFEQVLKIIDKQVLNFETDPTNVWARMNNEEIMRD